MKDSISIQLQKILKSAERDGGERSEVLKLLSQLNLSLEEVRILAGKDKLVLQEISEKEAKKVSDSCDYGANILVKAKEAPSIIDPPFFMVFWEGLPKCFSPSQYYRKGDHGDILKYYQLPKSH